MAVGFGYIRDTEPTQVDWGKLQKRPESLSKV